MIEDGIARGLAEFKREEDAAAKSNAKRVRDASTAKSSLPPSIPLSSERLQQMIDDSVSRGLAKFKKEEDAAGAEAEKKGGRRHDGTMEGKGKKRKRRFSA